MQPRRTLVLSLLFLSTLRPGELRAEGNRLDYGFQRYQESDHRMLIDSHYVRGQLQISEGTNVKFQGLYDGITGATPSGVLPDPTSGLPFLDQIHPEIRRAFMGAVSHKFGDHTVEAEFSRSEESDYLSRGYALSDSWELNQKNTTLNLGFNFLDDSVDTRFPGSGRLKKESYDAYLGVSQILDKNTVFNAGLTIGYSEGFLSDPYKVVQRTDLVPIPDPGNPGSFINIPVINPYRENRPDTRLREVLQVGVTHFFENLRGAADATYRFSHDDYGVNSHTLQVEWRQKVGSSWEVVPFARYYNQCAADFFVQTLDNLPIGTPPGLPRGDGIHYSADYRLSSFDALSGGLRVYYKLNDTVTFSASYERYSMNGQGSKSSPSQAYIDADIYTIGIGAKF